MTAIIIVITIAISIFGYMKSNPKVEQRNMKEAKGAEDDKDSVFAKTYMDDKDNLF
jgi:hypothetical protein